jgi:D-alanyl-lipoteichoic acid acyltransferase DltB (MBOAT superfamily)
MLFNSLEFLIFLPIVFILYWYGFNKTLWSRNAFLLVSSYLFYGWWDWRFLFLIAFSSFADYLIGLNIGQTEDNIKRKALLIFSLIINLGVLGFFKYFNFFQQEFINLFASFGMKLSPWSLQIVLPVGISFYTFQTLSYTIDIYRKNLDPTKDWLAFFAYVSFFPQLVAGPIERATRLLPQFKNRTKFNLIQAKDGLRQMLWGFFKKVIVADNCAMIVQNIFENHESMDSITLMYGAILFAFQIYGDFSGYSDIAIGTARLFGFDLMRNFAYPYFSRDIAEFWRRWHISLSTWFRDYVYIPFGGSRGGKVMQFRNVMIIFLVSGFWHGANWTFIIWGALHAIMFLPLMFFNRNRKNIQIAGNSTYLPSIREFISMLGTFLTTSLAWIFFRSDSVSQAFAYLNGIFDSQNFQFNLPQGLSPLLFILLLITIEWLQRKKEHGLMIESLRLPFRWSIYYALVLIIMIFKPQEQSEFIYFQF